MTSMDRWIAQNLRRLTLGQLLERGAELLAVFLFVFGSAVLAVKLLFPAAWPHVLWLALGMLPVAGLAWWLVRRERFTPVEAVALLDGRIRAGGLLMTLSEAPDDVWASHLPQVESAWRQSLPRVRPARFARYVSLPLLFAVGACLVPLREARPEPLVANLAGVQASQELASLLEVVEEAPVLEQADEQELREEIEKLIEETQQAPLTHEKWETVDALRERIKMQVDAAALTVSQARDAAAALAESELSEGQALSPEQVGQLEQNVLAALEKLAGSGGLSQASPALRQQLQRMLKQHSLKFSGDPAARKQQLAALQKFLESQCEKLGQCRSQCSGGQCQSPGAGRDGDGNPGRGGINRGRGDAEMSWGDESDAADTKFKEVVLPPGYLDELQDEVVGSTRTAPEVDPAPAAPRNVQGSTTAASGSETWNRPLRPRHKNVVRKYFDTP